MTAELSERRHLINQSYRLLGSPADAEEVVQESYAHWYAIPDDGRNAVVSPDAWLTTVTSRICLDLLGAVRVRRERHVGEWLPEPLPEGMNDPADQVTLDECPSRWPQPNGAEIVGRSPAACRQLASSARRRVRAPPAVPTAQRADVEA
ncbi:sigma factor [Herbidospora sp. RD11066]